MFDADYFNTRLRRDAEAMGGEPIVEVSLLSGHTHRVRSVVEVRDGYVVLEAYQLKGDLAHQRQRLAAAGAKREADEATIRVVAAYESVSAVVLDATQSQTRNRPGFA